MDNQKKIAITGGTGHIGSVIALKLGKERCILFARPTSVLPPALEGFETVVVDLSNKEQVLKASEGRAGIIHLACALDSAITLEFRKEVEIYGALSNILDAASAHSLPLVYISSVAARWASHSPVINHLPTTDTTYAPYYAEAYSRSKQLGEELLRERVEKDNELRACSILPSAVFGKSPSIGFWNKFIAGCLEKGHTEPIFFGPIQNPLVWVEDVAEVVVRALEKGKKRGEAYPCFGGDVGTSMVNAWVGELAGAWGVEFEGRMPEDYEEEGKWPSFTKKWRFENSITESELGVKFKKVEEVQEELRKYLEEREVWSKKE